MLCLKNIRKHSDVSLSMRHGPSTKLLWKPQILQREEILPTGRGLYVFTSCDSHVFCTFRSTVHAVILALSDSHLEFLKGRWWNSWWWWQFPGQVLFSHSAVLQSLLQFLHLLPQFGCVLVMSCGHHLCLPFQQFLLEPGYFLLHINYLLLLVKLK